MNNSGFYNIFFLISKNQINQGSSLIDPVRRAGYATGVTTGENLK